MGSDGEGVKYGIARGEEAVVRGVGLDGMRHDLGFQELAQPKEQANRYIEALSGPATQYRHGHDSLLS